MALYTTDYFIRPEDGWTLVATNPGELIIKPAVYHPWWVAIVDSGTPAATVVGVPMGRDPSERNHSYHLINGVTGLVYIRVATPTDSNVGEKMMFSVTTATEGLITPVPVGGTWTDRSILNLTGASQTLMNANASRHHLLIQNVAANNMGVNLSGGTAAIGVAGTITLAPGMSLEIWNYPPVAAITIIGTLNDDVTAFEG